VLRAGNEINKQSQPKKRCIEHTKTASDPGGKTRLIRYTKKMYEKDQQENSLQNS